MKKISLFITLLLFGIAGFSQTILYQDDLEGYPLNSYLAVENPTWWDTWSGMPGSGEDLQVKNIFSHSPSKSASIDTEGGPSDALLLLGDKFTGAYELSWWMYIETGKCGYYNIQHFESPGIEYAMHIYFRADGSFELTTGGETFYGTYPHDTWFEIKHNIDLDANYISLYINGSFIHDWPFSYQIYYTTGTKQLGSVDFGAYAVTGSGEVPLAYVDDFMYKEVPTGLHPTIQIDPASVATAVVTGTTGQEQLTVSNTGLTDLTYDINIIYDTDKKSTASLSMNKTSLESAAPLVNSGPDASVKLHYDGDHYISIGWSTPPVTVTVAARFPNQMTLPYAGMNLNAVQMFVDNLNAGTNQFTVRVFGMGTAGQPGPVLTTEQFTPTGASWDSIVLTNPVLVTGEDLWVGYTFTQSDPGIFIAGVDAGPNDPNGDFLNTGGGWMHLSDWPGFTYNWNIRANLEGTPAAQWLSADPMADTIGPGNNSGVDVNFDATLLSPGQYHATLKFLNNDPLNNQVDVPVTLDVVGVGIDETDKTGVMVYPNPAKDRIYVKSDSRITGIFITGADGKRVYSGQDQTIGINHLADGVYFIQTTTEKGTSNIRFVKKQ
jgi:hypothetical protein